MTWLENKQWKRDRVGEGKEEEGKGGNGSVVDSGVHKILKIPTMRADTLRINAKSASGSSERWAGVAENDGALSKRSRSLINRLLSQSAPVISWRILCPPVVCRLLFSLRCLYRPILLNCNTRLGSYLCFTGWRHRLVTVGNTTAYITSSSYVCCGNTNDLQHEETARIGLDALVWQAVFTFNLYLDICTRSSRLVSLPKPSTSAVCHNLTFGPSLVWYGTCLYRRRCCDLQKLFVSERRAAFGGNASLIAPSGEFFSVQFSSTYRLLIKCER